MSYPHYNYWYNPNEAVQKGWQCPCCATVWAPWMSMCSNCNPRHNSTLSAAQSQTRGGNVAEWTETIKSLDRGGAE